MAGTYSPVGFAKLIKDKYPEYADVPDLELTGRVIEKYPEYKANVNFSIPDTGILSSDKRNPIQKFFGDTFGALAVPKPEGADISFFYEEAKKQLKSQKPSLISKAAGFAKENIIEPWQEIGNSLLAINKREQFKDIIANQPSITQSTSRPQSWQEQNFGFVGTSTPVSYAPPAQEKIASEVRAGESFKDISKEYKAAPLGRAIDSFTSGALGTAQGLLGTAKALGLKTGMLDDWVRQGLEEVQVDNPTFANKLFAGAGSAATFFIPGYGATKLSSALALGPKLGKWLGTGTAAILEAGVNAGTDYNAMIEKGATPEEARKAAAKTFVMNVPLNIALDKWMFSEREGQALWKTITKGSLQEATQEGTQQVISNVNIGEPLTQGVGESALIGGVIGGGLGGALGLAQRNLSDLTTVEEQPAAIMPAQPIEAVEQPRAPEAKEVIAPEERAIMEQQIAEAAIKEMPVGVAPVQEPVAQKEPVEIYAYDNKENTKQIKFQATEDPDTVLINGNEWRKRSETEDLTTYTRSVNKTVTDPAGRKHTKTSTLIYRVPKKQGTVQLHAIDAVVKKGKDFFNDGIWNVNIGGKTFKIYHNKASGGSSLYGQWIVEKSSIPVPAKNIYKKDEMIQHLVDTVNEYNAKKTKGMYGEDVEGYHPIELRGLIPSDVKSEQITPESPAVQPAAPEINEQAIKAKQELPVADRTESAQELINEFQLWESPQTIMTPTGEGGREEFLRTKAMRPEWAAIADEMGYTKKAVEGILTKAANGQKLTEKQETFFQRIVEKARPMERVKAQQVQGVLDAIGPENVNQLPDEQLQLIIEDMSADKISVSDLRAAAPQDTLTLEQATPEAMAAKEERIRQREAMQQAELRAEQRTSGTPLEAKQKMPGFDFGQKGLFDEDVTTGIQPVQPEGPKVKAEEAQYNWSKPIPENRIPIPFTDAIRMYEALRGAGKIRVKKQVGPRPTIRGHYSPSDKVIEIRADLARNPEQAAKTLLHEIGHAIDLFDVNKLGKKNVFAHIANLKGYAKKTLAEYPGAPKGPLTQAERAKIRREAEKYLKSKAGEVEVYYVEEPIFKESGITPEDIKGVWNDPAFKEKNPELMEFIAKLSEADKKRIIVDAMKGTVNDAVKRFAKTEQVGTQKIRKERQVILSKEEITKLYQEKIKEEIKRRAMFEHEIVRHEMEELSNIWREGFSRESAYRMDANELYADTFSVWMNDPNLLKKEAPFTYRALENYMGARPEFKAEYEALQEQLGLGPQATADRLYRRLVQEREEAPQKILKARLERQKEMKKRFHITPFNQFMNIAFGEVWDIRRLAKQQDRAEVESALGNTLYKSSAMQAYLIEQVDALKAFFTKHPDVSTGEVDLFLRNLQTMTEENPKLTREGFRKEAQILAEKFRVLHGDEAYIDIVDLQHKLWTVREDSVLRLARLAELYAPETQDKLDGTPFYVPSQTAASFAGKEADYFSSKVKERVGNVEEKAPEATALLLQDLSIIDAALRKLDLSSVSRFLIENNMGEYASRGKEGLFVNPTNPYQKLIQYPHQGRMIGVYLPSNVVDFFNAPDRPRGVQTVMNVMNFPATVMRSLFTSKNPVFAVNNLMRDTLDTMVALKGAQVHNYLPLWVESLMEVIPAVYKGKYSPDFIKGLKQRAIPFFRTYQGYGADTTLLEYESLLKQFGLEAGFDTKKVKMQGEDSGWTPKAKSVARLMANVVKWFTDDISEVSEKINRLAAYKYVEKYMKHLSPEQRADIAMHATLSFKERGSITPYVNTILLFFNPTLKGRYRSIKALKDDPLKWLMYKSIFMSIALYTLYKKFIEKDPDVAAIPDSELINYTDLILGKYRIPFAKDPDTKFFTEVMIALFRKNPGMTGEIFRAFFSNGIEAGSVNPVLTWGYDIIQILSKRNPMDDFTGRGVLDKTTFGVDTGYDLKQYFNRKIAKGLGVLSFDLEAQGIEKVPVARAFKRAVVRTTDYGFREVPQKYRQTEEFNKRKNKIELESEFKSLAPEILSKSTPTTVLPHIHAAIGSLVKKGVIPSRSRKYYVKKLKASLIFSLTKDSRYYALASAESDEEMTYLLQEYGMKEFNIDAELQKAIRQRR